MIGTTDDDDDARAAKLGWETSLTVGEGAAKTEPAAANAATTEKVFILIDYSMEILKKVARRWSESCSKTIVERPKRVRDRSKKFQLEGIIVFKNKGNNKRMIVPGRG